VRVRSTRPPQPARLLAGASAIEVELLDSEEGVAPGQACVIYASDEPRARLLGGGVIRAAVEDGDRTAKRERVVEAI
jgi:tRNA-specific 2-thiouridylase